MPGDQARHVAIVTGRAVRVQRLSEPVFAAIGLTCSGTGYLAKPAVAIKVVSFTR